MLARLLILIGISLFASCNILRHQSGSICVYEAGINNCLTKCDYSSYSQKEEFKLEGTIFSFSDSMPVVDAWVWINKDSLLMTDFDGRFSIAIDSEEEITITIINQRAPIYKNEISPRLGKTLL